MTVSELKYLMTVEELCGDGTGAKMANVARSMGVSKVSVYHGVERLQADGYIARDGKRIVLSEKGRSALEEYKTVIAFICGHLRLHCGTPEEIAKEDAIGAACAFSDVGRKGITDFIKSGTGNHGEGR